MVKIAEKQRGGQENNKIFTCVCMSIVPRGYRNNTIRNTIAIIGMRNPIMIEAIALILEKKNQYIHRFAHNLKEPINVRKIMFFYVFYNYNALIFEKKT